MPSCALQSVLWKVLLENFSTRWNCENIVKRGHLHHTAEGYCEAELLI
jgi:hypothetical protein